MTVMIMALLRTVGHATVGRPDLRSSGALLACTERPVGTRQVGGVRDTALVRGGVVHGLLPRCGGVPAAGATVAAFLRRRGGTIAPRWNCRARRDAMLSAVI